MAKTRAAMIGIAAPLAFALLLLSVAPASAHHKAGHTKGGGKATGEASSGWTEDNDKNDGDTPNNAADDGDNKHPSGKDRSVENGGSGNQGNSTSDPDDDGRGPDRSNGGADKPNGPGGVDLADQDGNNGCGNDDDFEDDNEGWCGHKPKTQPSVGSRSTDRPKVDDNSCHAGDSSDDKSCKTKDEVNDDSLTCDDVESGAMEGKECESKSPEGTVPCVADAEMVNGTCSVVDDVGDLLGTEVLGKRVERADSASPAVVEDTTIAAAADSAGRSPSLLARTGSGVVRFLVLAFLMVVIGLVLLRARRRV